MKSFLNISPAAQQVFGMCKRVLNSKFHDFVLQLIHYSAEHFVLYLITIFVATKLNVRY